MFRNEKIYNVLQLLSVFVENMYMNNMKLYLQFSLILFNVFDCLYLYLRLLFFIL